MRAALRVIRIVLFCAFVVTTFSVRINIYSIGLLTTFLVSVYLTGQQRNNEDEDETQIKEYTTKQILDSLYPLVPREDLQKTVDRSVRQYVTYDATETTSLQHFKEIKEHSECIFARRAKLWGSKDWNPDLALEENIFRCCATLLQFTVVCRQRKLDGFVFEIPSKGYAENLQEFGQTVKRVLQTLSNNDPKHMFCMDNPFIDKPGWVFQFNKVTFFVTTFASFYPPDNSRYAFGCEGSFIFLQPELSFAIHDLSPDTVHTNYENPITERDRIRKAFQDAGRGYVIPKDTHQPMVWDIVKPLNNGDDVIEWWK